MDKKCEQRCFSQGREEEENWEDRMEEMGPLQIEGCGSSTEDKRRPLANTTRSRISLPIPRCVFRNNCQSYSRPCVWGGKPS